LPADGTKRPPPESEQVLATTLCGATRSINMNDHEVTPHSTEALEHNLNTDPAAQADGEADERATKPREPEAEVVSATGFMGV
jgi:hypothetical protein